MPAKNDVDRYALLASVLICLQATVFGDQQSDGKCKLQQPVRDFKILTNDAICRQPNPPACNHSLIFICAFHINGSLGAGCIERICLHGQSCPRFTKLQIGHEEREETFIQEGTHDDDFCRSCNNSFYNITHWRDYEECYRPRTTFSKNNTKGMMTNEMDSSLKEWEVALIIVIPVVVLSVVTVLCLKCFCGHLQRTVVNMKLRTITKYRSAKLAKKPGDAEPGEHLPAL